MTGHALQIRRDPLACHVGRVEALDQQALAKDVRREVPHGFTFRGGLIAAMTGFI
jgi:hypothetical protein